MAAMIALQSASIETYDICLSAHVLIQQDGTFILDPNKEQMKEKMATNVTVAVMPSLGQVVCCNVVGIATKNVVTSAIRFAAEKCLDYQQYIEKVLLEPLTGQPAGSIV